jgi:hypothetical protein
MKKSKNILQNILQKLELGETLVSICRDKDMPGQSTVNTWMREDDKFKDKVLDARRMGAMVWLDKCQELLDQEVEPQKVQWYREKLHHARWLVSKLVNVFGDKQTVVNEGDPVIQVVWKEDGSTADKQADLAHTTRSSEKNEKTQH